MNEIYHVARPWLLTRPTPSKAGQMALNSLRPVYETASYWLHHSQGTISFFVGKPSIPLGNLMHGRCGALLTAYNPKSVIRSPQENEAAQAELLADLEGYRIMAASGSGENWPAEPSFFVIDLPKPMAEALAHKYGQSAYLWIKGDTAHLVMTDHEGVF